MRAVCLLYVLICFAATSAVSAAHEDVELGVWGNNSSVGEKSCRSSRVGGVTGDDWRCTREFSVRDSIELTRIVPFKDPWNPNPTSGTVLFSPDRSHLVFKTVRGDLDKNVNIEQLLVIRTADVSGPSSAGGGVDLRENGIPHRTLVSVAVSAAGGSISDVRWIDDQEIGYIAEAEGGIAQAHVVNARDGQIRQITHSERDVRGFDVRGDRVVYYAVAPPSTDDSIPVDGKTIDELLSAEDYLERQIFPRLTLMTESSKSGRPAPINVPTVRLYQPFHRIWLSPSGNFAITLVPATDAPAGWSRYTFPKQDVLGYAADHRRSDPTSPDLQFRTRYQLVDLRTNDVRSLLDAPIGYVMNTGQTVQEAIWLNDEQSVIVSNTLLPLEEYRNDFEVRRATPAIAEVNIRTGLVMPIMWEPTALKNPTARIDALHWYPRAQKLAIRWIGEAVRKPVNSIGPTQPSVERTVQFAKAGRRWRELSTTSASARSDPSVELRQDLNVPPRLCVAGAGTICVKRVFDPNPTINQYTFGTIIPYLWTDEDGRGWSGALVYPPGREGEKGFPLVIQTHGFQPHEFLIDGPFGATTAFAAQPFANAGFLVLQIEENRMAETGDEREGVRYASGILAAISNLISAGLVDRSRIGIIGWSRTSFQILQVLGANPGTFAAATLADGMQPGYVSYIFNINSNRDLVDQINAVTGGPPARGALDEWMSRNPLYGLSRSRTPIRLEAMGAYSLIRMWETYASLKYAGHPVEYLYFPHGIHVLTRPSERIASQQGNVDWFRFWLQGYENAVPSTANQYSRWRRLRDSHRRTADTASTSMMHN